MTSIDDEPKTGYRIVQRTQYRKYWQQRLFEHIRTSPKYRTLAEKTPEDAARELRLVSGGVPVEWAIELIQRERDIETLQRAREARGEEPFGFSREPRVLSRASKRYIEISASLNSMSVDTWNVSPRPGAWPQAAEAHRPEPSMYIGDGDWKQLEELAVAAAREAVRNMQRALERYNEPGNGQYQTQTISLGRDSKRETQIEQLGYILTGRASSPLPRMTLQRLCELLGLDIPRH